MAGIARGKIIVGDASGDPSVLAPGTNGQVLSSDGTDLAFADISVSSLAADNLSVGDAAVLLTTSSGNITLDAAANDSDIIFKGTDGGSDTLFLTIDGSDAGSATFGDKIIVGDGKLVLNSTAVSSTAAELNALDGITAVVGELNALDIGSTAIGTAVASKAVILDSNKDYTGIRNLTISGEIDAATGDFSGVVDVAGATTTAAITASGIIKTDDSTAATSTTDGSLQTDGGLSVVLDAVIGDDIILISDAAQIAFGVNSEITLAHVHNVGLTLTHVTAGDNLPVVLQLKSEEDAVVANEVIGSIEFAAGDSDGTDGATVAAGIHAIAEDTFSASANATKLVFTTGVSETAASSATAKATLSSIGDFQVAGDLVVKDGGLIGSASDLDAIAIASDGVVTFTQALVTTGITIGSTAVSSTAAELNALDGITAVVGELNALDIGSTAVGTAVASKAVILDSNKDYNGIRNLTISGGFAPALITSSGIIKTDDTSAATSTTDGSLQTDGGLSVAADAVIGDDLFLLSDLAVLTFGADKDVTLTHVHNAGIMLNTNMQLRFRDSAISIGSAADGDLDIKADDEISIDSTLIDINGNVEISGTTAIAAITMSTIVASGIIKTDDSTAATSTTDGSLQTDGGLSVVLDAVIGDDIIMISDAAQIAFGANSEITLAHVHNVGLTLTHVTAGDNLPIVLQLKSEEDVVAANEVIASIEFAAGDSDGTDGATVAAGIHAIAEGTFSASANATKLVFTTGVSETAASSATAKMTLASDGDLTVVGTVTADPTAVLLIKNSGGTLLKTINGIAAN